MGTQKLNADNATHLLLCRHCVGLNCRDYVMPCHILKFMPDGRIKLLVFGDRDWKDTQHIRKVRYVEADRVRQNFKGKTMDLDFDSWYSILLSLASKHGENVSDEDAWRESFDDAQWPEDAFYSEYPEHKKGDKNG